MLKIDHENQPVRQVNVNEKHGNTVPRNKK